MSLSGGTSSNVCISGSDIFAELGKESESGDFICMIHADKIDKYGMARDASCGRYSVVISYNALYRK